MTTSLMCLPPGNCSESHPSRSMRVVVGPAAALIVALTVLAGCGTSASDESGVASLPSDTASSATSAPPDGASGGTPSALAYSQCMRSHGIKDFPDPNADGRIQLTTGPTGDLDMNSPTFKAADEACKHLLPNAGGKPSAEVKAANLKYAGCMRDHGIKDFPDPKPDGALQLQSAPGSDLDPNNPTYRSANDACQQYLPNGGAGQQLDSSAG